jgi:hypothetical protein
VRGPQSPANPHRLWFHVEPGNSTRERLQLLPKGDANHEKVMRPLDGQGVTAVAVWNECYGCAREIYYDLVVDPTHSATFYHDKRLLAPPHAELVDADWLIYESAWGLVQFTTKIGHLSFYRQVTRHAGNA